MPTRQDAIASARLRELADDYGRWAPTYEPRPHNRLMEVEQQAMLALLPPVAGRRALDAGCGTGRYLRVLRDLGAAMAVGCDVSPAMLARAPGPCVMRSDVCALPFQAESFDVIVCGLALPDVDDLPAAVGEMGRVIAHGGSLVASLLHPRGAREGWRRTFETPQGQRELRACWHTLDDLRSACADACLTLVAVRARGLAGEPNPVAMVIRADKPDPRRGGPSGPQAG
jgi:malonyl-CoA O-methyltransferase